MTRDADIRREIDRNGLRAVPESRSATDGDARVPEGAMARAGDRLRRMSTTAADQAAARLAG